MKIKQFLIIFFLILGITSCSLLDNSEKFSFKDVTSFSIEEIKRVDYNNGPSQSLISRYEGDYKVHFDTKYVLCNMEMDMYREHINHYYFCFFLTFENENSYYHIYIIESKLYLIGEDGNLYCSQDKIPNVKGYIGPCNHTYSNEICNWCGSIKNNNNFTIDNWKNAKPNEKLSIIGAFIANYNLTQMNKQEVLYYLSTPDKEENISTSSQQTGLTWTVFYYYLNKESLALKIKFNSDDTVGYYEINIDKDLENNHNSSKISSCEFIMTNDYGSHVKGEVSLLFDYSYLNADLLKYGIIKSNLVAGDIVKIYYTGDLYTLESYPGQILIKDGAIINAELFPAERVNFRVAPIPGGGLDIISDDGRDYIFPEYLIYENNFANIDQIYDGLEFIGTMPYNASSNYIHALYAKNYDPSKVNINNNLIDENELLNKYFEEMIKAITFTKLGNYSYNITIGNSYEKNYIYNNGTEYIYFNDGKDNLSDCLIEINYEKIIYNTSKVRYEDECDRQKKEYYRKYSYSSEENLIKFYNENKPLENGKEYNGYTLEIITIDPCCGGPTYIIFDNPTTSYDDFKFEYSTTYLDYDSFFNYENILSQEEYINLNIDIASLIKIEGEYNLLDLMNNYPVENEYLYNPGFGVYQFINKKYDFNNRDSIMVYEVTSYPDYGFSDGEYITDIYISDKDINFNNLTLNSTLEEIINTYESLGFIKYESENEYGLANEGVRITINKECKYIRFSTEITNLTNVVF